MQFLQHLFKQVTVLCPFDCGTVRTDQLHSALHQRLGKVDGRLTAKRTDHAFRRFKIDDCHNIFRCQRFKIQLIGSGVIGGNRFRVIVHNDCFVTGAADRLHGMHGRIVKLHTLTDPDRTGTNDDYLFPIRKPGLILSGIGRIQICNIRSGMQGIDHTEYRYDAAVFPHAVN